MYAWSGSSSCSTRINTKKSNFMWPFSELYFDHNYVSNYMSANNVSIYEMYSYDCMCTSY